MRPLLLASGLLVTLGLVACGGTSDTSAPGGDGNGGSGSGSGSSGSGSGSGSGGADSGTGSTPADSGSGSGGGQDSGGSSSGGGIDASYPPDPTDGTPTRQACTSTFGSALSATHGRLDGTLVALVAPGSGHGCNGDSSHLHLQMLVSGSIYDVATNLDTLYYEKDMAMPGGGAWSEGWHTADALDYPTIGVHSSAFTQPASQGALTSLLESALANANHLSVYATGYGPDGIHDVHRRGGGGNDGAIVIDPLSPTSHVFYFCFNTDSF